MVWYWYPDLSEDGHEMGWDRAAMWCGANELYWQLADGATSSTVAVWKSNTQINALIINLRECWGKSPLINWTFHKTLSDRSSYSYLYSYAHLYLTLPRYFLPPGFSPGPLLMFVSEASQCLTRPVPMLDAWLLIANDAVFLQRGWILETAS